MKVNENYEQFKAGMAMVELARVTVDRKTALKLTKDGMELIGAASKSYFEDPENWCPTPPIPWPWPRPNWIDIYNQKEVIRNISKLEVLAELEKLNSEIKSVTISNSIKVNSKEIFSSISF